MADNKKKVNTKNAESPLFKNLTRLFSGPIVNYRHAYQSRYKRGQLDKFNFTSRKIYVPKIGMKEICEQFGQFQFISIDVEGYSAELALQDWFNPKAYGCMLIAIEPDNLQTKLQEKFTKLGYTVIGHTGDNIIFGLI